ncbi:MAG: peptide ABC transporter substrate-binding protein [Pseudomonadota bacterium]
MWSGLTSCGSPASDISQEPSSRTLTRGNGGQPGTLDPARAVDIHAFNVLGDLYEGLVTIGSDGTITPGAAARWQADAGLRRFEFELRADARWSTGEPVTAADFVRGLRRLADPDTNAPYASLFANISGFAAVQAGDAPLSALSVRAEGPRTLIIELDAPGHTLLDVLAMSVAAPVHASNAADGGFDDPERFVSNGAYRLASYRRNDRIALTANPHHRDVGRLGYCRVEYLPVVDPSTEVTMYRAGDLDMTHSLPPQQVATLRERLPDAVHIAPQLGTYFLALDVTEPALANRDLRRALSMAVDRHALVAMLGRGEQPAWGLLPPGLVDDAHYGWAALDDSERVIQARATYLRALGDAPPPELRLVFDAGDVHERIALTVAGMWRDSLGIEAVLDKREWGYFLDTRQRRTEWDAMRYAWFADYADAASFLGLFREGSEHNLPGYSDAGFEAALDLARGADTKDARAGALSEAALRIDDAYALIPLYHYVSKRLVHPDVAGYAGNLLDRHPSRHLSPRAAPERGCLP